MSFLKNKINFENLNLFQSSMSCLLMALFYVISLYLWSKQNRYNRNDPSVIKRRFLSVILSSVLSLVFIYVISQSETIEKKNNYRLNEWIGFRFDANNFFKSIIYSLFLTTILFSGPIIQSFVSQYYYELSEKLYIDKQLNSRKYNNDNGNKVESISDLNTIENFFQYLNCSIKSFFKDFSLELIYKKLLSLSFLRNYVISTFTEEFVFRSCMLPLLLPHLGFTKTILITPLYFGTAHLHHIIEGLKTNDDTLKVLVVRHLFQFFYTYLFGLYSSYLFLRTGSFFSSFLNHSFCNYLGFPNFDELFTEFRGKTRTFLCIIYLTGFILFFCLISTLTNPIYYDNKVYSNFY